jgi:hypothetical protein
MWHVATEGDLPNEYGHREHEGSIAAWDDYAGRILECEIDGFARADEEATQYGRTWVCSLSRGVQRMNVSIERVA